MIGSILQAIGLKFLWTRFDNLLHIRVFTSYISSFSLNYNNIYVLYVQILILLVFTKYIYKHML